MKTRQLTLIGTVLAVSALSLPFIINETAPKPEIPKTPNLELIDKLVELGCTEPAINHIFRYSNLLDDFFDGTYYVDAIGYPDDLSKVEFDKCVSLILEIRTISNGVPELDPNPEPSFETPESLLAQFEILANEDTKLQDARTLKMQELESARANKSDAVSSLEAELDVINERLKQNGIKLDQIRTATSKFYEIDSQLKAILEKAQQILTDNHDLIPWNGLGIDPKSKTLWIEFESSYLADKYTQIIKKLIGEDIPLTVFVGKNTFD